MTPLAMVIVLTAAFLHAGWNYLAKKSLNKIVFIWWFVLAAVVFYFPMFLYFRLDTHITWQGWVCIGVTGVVHTLYFLFLGTAYERGDLSLVYPLSRGSGPLFVPILAFFFIQETVSVLGAWGILLVVLGLFVVHLRSFSMRALVEPFQRGRGSGQLWALCTGGTIAAYSIVDKIGVGLVNPPVYIYLMFVINLAFLTPFVLAAGRDTIALEWRTNKGAILAAGWIVLGTYMMVLFAFNMAKVSYVVAIRETSIVFSVLYGVYRLGEKHGPQKLLGAVLIAAGVIGIGLAE
jgi:drug/metabolite transporter (DMT)-like permease